ncbi:GNAT family N-acetyltransferase [Cohnella lubricantis]|uniref:GNAT family N-acetyltransferase n=1 Tax=Cohnella lubricantis TaxID=2163172 RepID=A0A841TEU3_9BACL|nr:GNAT family N-acetyltransferase [Cohnella lubricantis]MBB6677818.1 GNAT family N-acetyltransferase [Cohnella lubricantis]MBP2120507.1 RimJ/RimL family protein N-acetyltransferase [Cohnella lubricantis]
MNLYTYRPLAEEDIEVICAWPQNADELFYMGPSFQFPLRPEQIKSRLPGRYLPTVMLNRDQVPVAYANLYDLDTDEGSCWLGNVIVAPDYRRAGASSFLIETMMTRAREELGCRRLKLRCHNTNTRALLLYTKNGFIPCGSLRMVNHEGQTIVGIDMEIRLDREDGNAVPAANSQELDKRDNDTARTLDEFDTIREGIIWDEP